MIQKMDGLNNNQAMGGTKQVPPQANTWKRVLSFIIVYAIFSGCIFALNGLYKMKMRKDMEALKQAYLKANAAQIAKEDAADKQIAAEMEIKRREAFSLSVVRQDENKVDSALLFKQAVEAEKAKNNPNSVQQAAAPTPGQQYEAYQAQLRVQEQAQQQEAARRAQAQADYEAKTAVRTPSAQPRKQAQANIASPAAQQQPVADTAAPSVTPVRKKRVAKQAQQPTQINKLETKKVY